MIFKKFPRNILTQPLAYIGTFLKWIFLAGVTGSFGGLLGAVFSKSVAFVTGLRTEHTWLIYFLPLGGLSVVYLYKLCRVRGVGTNEVFRSVLSEKQVPVLLAPAIFFGSVVTHLFGGSAGKEGAALQLGGSLAALFGRMFRLDSGDRHILTMCGMSALFSAVFGTPVGACVFALEVVSIGHFHSAAFFPCLTASLSAYGISSILGVSPERFTVGLLPELSALTMLRIIAVAALCAAVSVIFCHALHFTSHVFEKYIKNPYLRIITGGIIIVALTLLFGSYDYNGGGIGFIEEIFHDGKVVPYAFLLKILFTSVTIGSGFKGGEIVPTLFIGASLGVAVASLSGLPAPFSAALGMTALFCGVTNCPLASVFIACELFGSEGLAFFAAASVISFLLSGNISLYSGQKIVYSKLHDEEI